jgi:hypothetical protein
MRTMTKILVSIIAAAAMTLSLGWWSVVHYGRTIGLTDANIKTFRNPLFGAGVVGTILLTFGFYRLLRIKTFIIVARFALSLLFALAFTAAIDPAIVISLWKHSVYTEDGLVWVDVLSLTASAFFALWLSRKIARRLFSI